MKLEVYTEIRLMLHLLIFRLLIHQLIEHLFYRSRVTLRLQVPLIIRKPVAQHNLLRVMCSSQGIYWMQYHYLQITGYQCTQIDNLGAGLQHTDMGTLHKHAHYTCVHIHTHTQTYIVHRATTFISYHSTSLCR